MNRTHKRRFYFIAIFLAGIAISAALILYSLKQNINVFLTPSQLVQTSVNTDYHLRLGGLVKEKSVQRDKEGLGVQFVLTDYKRDITVRYVGILPDLFREGKGAVVEGTLNKDGTFNATQVLAKHDENYMPKNVYKALRENNK